MKFNKKIIYGLLFSLISIVFLSSVFGIKRAYEERELCLNMMKSGGGDAVNIGVVKNKDLYGKKGLLISMQLGVCCFAYGALTCFLFCGSARKVEKNKDD